MPEQPKRGGAQSSPAKVTIKAPATPPGASSPKPPAVTRLTMPGRGARLLPIVTTREKEFEHEGRCFTAADFARDLEPTFGGFQSPWLIEFCEEEAAEVETMSCIHADRCQAVEIMKTRDGLFFMIWEEAHPQLGTINEFFTGRKLERFGLAEFDRTEDNIDLWNARIARFPYTHYALPLTRRQAYELIGRFYMPGEFQRDMGLATRL